MKNLTFSLEKMLPGTEIDYSSLIRFLSEFYRAPARKLQELQKSEDLIRLKKGFYILNPKKTSRVYRPTAVANLLYGPSYLSLEYALSHYGLIPERVEEMTSVTPAKNKVYQTKVGVFSYDHLSMDLYPLFTEFSPLEGGGNYLIATPEKAIFDWLTLKTSDNEFKTPSETKAYLEADIRVDWKQLLNLMNTTRLKDALPYYQRRKRVRWFIENLLEELS
jgi:hypothetical protein